MKRTIRIMIYGAAGCGACASEARSCFAPALNLARHGFVPTGNPRVADALIVAGALNARSARVVRNLRAAMPKASIVIAVGDCATEGCRYSVTDEAIPVSEAVDAAQSVKKCPHDSQELVNTLLALFEEGGEEHHDENV